MKKIIAIALVIFMMAAMAVPAFAASFVDDVVENAGGTTITYGATQAYTVTVPADFSLAANTDTKANISVSNYMIATTKTLKISVNSVNAEGDTWKLVEYVAEGAQSTNAAPVPYTIKVGETPILPNTQDDLTRAVVLTLDTASNGNGAAGEEVSSELTFNTAGTSQVAVFKDTITFSVAIADKVQA